MSKKQWIVYSPEVDLYYFYNYDDALKEYESLKDYLMAEGHETGTQVHLLETIKVATSVIDEERMKINTPKDEGFEWDNWAKWNELKATIEWEHSYEKQCLELQTALEKVIEANNKTTEKNERFKKALIEISMMKDVGFAPEYVLKRYSEYAKDVLEGKQV